MSNYSDNAVRFHWHVDSFALAWADVLQQRQQSDFYAVMYTWYFFCVRRRTIVPCNYTVTSAASLLHVLCSVCMVQFQRKQTQASCELFAVDNVDVVVKCRWRDTANPRSCAVLLVVSYVRPFRSVCSSRKAFWTRDNELNLQAPVQCTDGMDTCTRILADALSTIHTK